MCFKHIPYLSDENHNLGMPLNFIDSKYVCMAYLWKEALNILHMLEFICRYSGNNFSQSPAPPPPPYTSPPPSTKPINRPPDSEDSTNPSNNANSNKNSLSGGKIAGIIFAVLLAVIAAVLGFIVFARRSPKKRYDEEKLSNVTPFSPLEPLTPKGNVCTLLSIFNLLILSRSI